MGNATSGSKPSCNRHDATAVLVRLRQAGHVAYFAGGCVRDVLMGLEPTDWDIATDAPPDRVRKLFSRTQAVGAAFGVILVRYGSSTIEVATFRAEGVYHDGRRPSEVRFTSAEEDARRRDFTINGLFLDPIDNRVIDYVGGQADIAGRIIRAIGDPVERFDEDHLRLLRAVRFAARLGFEIEPQTRQAIVRLAPKLPRISPERVGDELRRMLTPTSRDRAMEMLEELGLAEQVLRSLPLDRLPRAGKVGPSLSSSPAEGLPSTRPVASAQGGLKLNPIPDRPISFPLGLATFILRFGSGRGTELSSLLEPQAVKEIVRVVRKSLRLSNEESRDLAEILDVSHLLKDDFPRVAVLKRFLARPTSGQSRALLQGLAKAGFEVDRITALEMQFQRLSGQEVAPPPLLTGDDLLAAGYPPGPAFKHVLEATYDAQLESQVTDRSQALELARRLMSQSAKPFGPGLRST